MSGDRASDNQVGNDNNTHLLNCTHPGRTVIASESGESKEGSCRQDHIQMKEGVYDDGQANKEPPLVVVPSTSTSVNDFESVTASAIEQEQCREHASTKPLALQQTPIDDSRSVMVLPTILLANHQPNDQLNSFVCPMLTGFQYMSLQMQECTATLVSKLEQSQNEMRNDLAGVKASMDNLERIFNQQSEIHRAQLQQIDTRLQEQEQRYGHLVVQGHEDKNVPLWKKVVLEMIEDEQVLVVLGALAFGFISYRLLIWAIPHIVKAVPVIYSRFANLAHTARLHLANVDWKEFIRRFANIGSEGGFNFEEFMNHRLTKEITRAKYGQIIAIFFGTLLEIILKQRGDLMKV